MAQEGGRVNDLHLFMLGSPKVWWKGAPLTLPRRQVRALLYRLAAASHPLTRDHLCFLFWPDLPQARSRRNLTHLLTHLRRTLPDPSLLMITSQDIWLDFHRVDTDTGNFIRYVEVWRSTGENDALRRAVALYRGSFLGDFSLATSPEFEQWLTMERQRWQQRYLDALRHLIESCTTQGNLEEAIRYARVYLSTDNLAEEIHRRLIALYAATGDRSAALRQYETCAAALERELGIEPLPETRTLYEAVLTGHSVTLGARSPQGPIPIPTALRVPLVGRKDALASLARAYERAQSGRGQVILISGEAGIGKTRLAREFVHALPGRIIVATAHPGTQRLPYYPLVQALRSHLDTLAAVSASGTSPVDAYGQVALPRTPAPIWLAELARLLPELRARIPHLPSPMPGDPEEVRLRLFEALTQAIFTLAAGVHPAVLCLDDLHWADQTTLEWLGYLAARLGGRRLVVLATYRIEEAEIVRDVRHHLRRVGGLTEIHLHGLPVEDIRHLLQHLFGSQPDVDVLAHRLHQATGGNPFFLLETLRALAEQQIPPISLDFRHLPLPDTVCQAVEAHLARLTPQARQVLEAGSILEDQFSFDLIYLVAGRSEAETVTALEELLSRQLLVVREGHYRFVHDLVRQAVAHNLNPVRSQLLHRRAARAVARLRPEALAARAHHLEAGGALAEALGVYLHAATKSQTLGAWQEVDHCYTRALALLDALDPHRCDPAYVQRRADILIERAHMRFLQGRLAERDADIALLEDLAETCGSDVLRLQVYLVRSRYLNLDGRYEEALTVAHDGLRLAERLKDDTARARLLARIGFAHYFRGEHRDALKALQTALALERGESAARGEILSVLSYTHYLLADYRRSLEYRQQALDIRRRLGRLARVAEDLTDMGILHTRLNHLKEAERYLKEALTLARKIGSQPAASYALNNLGNLYYLQGNYLAALDHYRRSLVLQRATGSRRGEASALGNMGMVYLALGDYAQAEAQLRRSLQIEEEIGYESGIANDLTLLAQSLTVQGQADAALDAGQRALQVARRIGDRYCQVMALHTLADVHLRRGDAGTALKYADEAVDIAQDVGLEHGRVLALTVMARIHLVQGDKGRALDCIQEAVRLLDMLGALEGPAELVYRVYADVLTAIGKRIWAARVLCRSRAILHAKASHIPDPLIRKRYLQTALCRWRLQLRDEDSVLEDGM